MPEAQLRKQMNIVEKRVERFLLGRQSACQLMSVEGSKVVKGEIRIRNSVKLSLLLLKLRSLGWNYWKVTFTWPRSLTFSRSYDLRERKHLKSSTYTVRQELGRLRPQLDTLSDILSDTMSSLVPPNGGPATTTNQSASSRSSQAVSRVLHSSSYVTLSNSRSKSKAVSYNLTPHTSSCLLMSVERNSTRTSQIADVLLSKDVSKGNFKFGHTRCWIRNYSGKLCSMETIVDKLYQLNYDTISSEKAATVVYIPFLCDFTMMLFVIIIVSFIVQLQQTSQPQAITILASTL